MKKFDPLKMNWIIDLTRFYTVFIWYLISFCGIYLGLSGPYPGSGTENKL